MARIKNKIAVVTGGASGLGEAIARRFVLEGATVVITDINSQRGEALADELGCDFLHQDVTDEKQWRDVVDNVEKKYHALHILINNAGIEGPIDNTTGSPETTSLSDWQAVQRVNVEGVFLGCRAAISVLRRSGGGSIVNLSSIAALAATPGHVAYGASKAAVWHLTKSVARHCAVDGSKIRCNSVHPGIILTPMLERILKEKAKNQNMSADDMLNEFKQSIPQNEFQTPEDIANAVLFLASDEARHITGTQLIVDGGYTMGG